MHVARSELTLATHIPNERVSQKEQTSFSILPDEIFVWFYTSKRWEMIVYDWSK